MTVLTELLAFSLDCHPWQQDMLRRLFTNGALMAADEEDAYTMLKADYGLVDKGTTPVPAAIPLNASHTGHASPVNAGTILNSIDRVANCNRLAENQRIDFAVEGITLIYGDNGSGKSGYCRILKSICRTREAAREPILGDAFKAAVQPPASAAIRFSPGKGKAAIEHEWKYGDGPIPELSCISVFDAKAEPLYANDEKKIEYLPQGLDVLPRLGALCVRLSERLDAEMNALRRTLAEPLPHFHPRSDAADLAAKLTENNGVDDLPSVQQINEMGTWSPELDSELSEICKALVVDPLRLAQRCRLVKSQVEVLIRRLAEVEDTVGSVGTRGLCEKLQAAAAARSAATFAAEVNFADEPLGGVGTQDWQLMFQHARAYSAVAYPGEPFPVTGPDKHCLLCQQTLDEKASERLRRFDEFVRNNAAKDAAKAESLLHESVQAVARYSLDDDPASALAGVEELLPDRIGIREKLSNYFSLARQRSDLIVKALPSVEGIYRITPLPPPPVGDLQVLLAELENLAKKYESQNNPAARAELEKRKVNLEAKRVFCDNVETIRLRLLRLLVLEQTKMAKRACNSRAISAKNTELRIQREITSRFGIIAGRARERCS